MHGCCNEKYTMYLWQIDLLLLLKDRRETTTNLTMLKKSTGYFLVNVLPYYSGPCLYSCEWCLSNLLFYKSCTFIIMTCTWTCIKVYFMLGTCAGTQIFLLYYFYMWNITAYVFDKEIFITSMQSLRLTLPLRVA